MPSNDGRHQRGDRTRAALLDSCMRIIAAHGVAGATQRSVAEAAGTSLASTTYHFTTRAGLLAATLDHAASIAVTEIDAVRQEILEGRLDPVAACLQYIQRQRSGQSHTAIVVFELAIAAIRETSLRDANRRFIDALRDLFVPFAPAPGAAAAIADSFYGVLLLELSRGGGPPAELERTVRALFDGFGVTEAVRLAGARR